MKENQLTLAVGKADGKSLLLGLALGDVGGGVPDPAAVTADVGAQLHLRNDYNIGLGQYEYSETQGVGLWEFSP